MRVARIVGGVIALAVLAPVHRGTVAQQLPTSEDCIACHLELDEERLVAPARDYGSDIHADRGFSCLACHGRIPAGHAEGQAEASLGFIARPTPGQIPELCGSCHSDIQFMKQYDPSLRVDQLAEYLTSGHGQALAEGDTAVATCVSCHPAHAIRPPSDPQSSVYPTRVAELCGSCHGDVSLMEARGLPSDPLEAYRSSVHGRLMYEDADVSAPTCNDCHGNHGAAPPGVAAVEQVCGQCHSRMAEQFAASGHELPFIEASLPGCATCHGNHAIAHPSDADLVTRGEEVCEECHADAGVAQATFPRMLVLIDSLQAVEAEARSILARAEDLGMEVSQAQFELEDVTNALNLARTAVHTFRVDAVEAEIDEGLVVVESARTRGEDALWEHGFRRAGLAGSAVFILLLVVGLVLKIRAIEGGDRAPSRSTVGQGGEGADVT
ncbi:MAG: cytochrome c3 family protein [Gemmatimonadota bacterium]